MVSNVPDDAHWNAVYTRREPGQLSWFQPHLVTSLRLIDAENLSNSAAIIDVGGGASTLVDDLLDRGFFNPTVLDLSSAALEVSKQRLGERASKASWIAGSVLEAVPKDANYDLWHDRAVFHFLTQKGERERYVKEATRAIRPGGALIVGTFALDGPERCSGLEVVRYDAETLQAEFGASFRWMGSALEKHSTPSGTTQSFIYGQFRRT
jgi:ubiquinone/menaquinone biosynthesis C-methylase UbiE